MIPLANCASRKRNGNVDSGVDGNLFAKSLELKIAIVSCLLAGVSLPG